MNCPICCHPACATEEIREGLVAAACRECAYVQANATSRIDLLAVGVGESVELALEDFLFEARQLCASDQIPALPCPLVPRVPVVVEVLEQAREEFERQRGFRLVAGIMFERSNDEYVAKRSLYLEIDHA